MSVLQHSVLNLNKKYIAVLILIFSGQNFLCDADRTKDRMYEPINEISACFRRMNGTHQIGCSSVHDGSTGVVHFVETESDLDFVYKSQSNIPYIPTIPVRLFTKETIEKFKSLDNIAGVLVYETNETIKSFTHDQKCPNEGSNVDGTCKINWNQPGSGLLMENIPMPVFYLNNATEIEKVKSCFGKFNNFSYEEHGKRSLCAVELDSFMFAAYDTPTCMRRSHVDVNIHPVKFCDPMGDQNVWYSLFPMGTSKLTPDIVPKSNIKYIILAARMDTTSMFHDLTPGAHSSVTGLVTLLATAQLLKKMLPVYKSYDKNVVFAVFNGESFDYIGSQRVFYDIINDQYPGKAFKSDSESVRNIKLEEISLMIEISQLVRPRDGKIHVYEFDETPESTQFINDLQEVIKVEKHSGIIPPSSAQSFVRNETFRAAIVVADFDNITGFQNPFYNSIYDDAKHIDFTYANLSDSADVDVLPKDSVQVFLGTIVHAVAHATYKAVTNVDYVGEADPDLYVINELLHCYLENANCSIHRALRKGYFREQPLSLYVGVTVAPNFVTNLVGLTLVFLAGDKINQGPCPGNLTSQIYYHFNMSESVDNLNSSTCYRASMNLTEAVSPAFLIKEYDWRSGQYSTWSESVWKDFKVRLFLRPARSHELMTILLGSCVVALSLFLTLFIQFKKEILFREISTTYL